MENSFQLDIISLTRPAFSGKVDSVTVPGAEGEMTILKNHIPLITPLASGEVVIRNGKEITNMAVSSGFLIVEKEKVSLMVDSAEKLEEMDEDKIQEAKSRAEKLLTEKKFATDREFADTIASLEKSVAHLHMIKRHRHRKG
jgi:F-type H+-transporting ATPase subunit epsilon